MQNMKKTNRISQEGDIRILKVLAKELWLSKDTQYRNLNAKIDTYDNSNRSVLRLSVYIKNHEK